MKPRIIYVYDAFCTWCFGFSPVMRAICENYADDFDFEVLSGGMIRGEQIRPSSDLSGFPGNEYKSVEETTGIIFGQGFLHNLENGELIFNSEVPAIALSVYKGLKPQHAVEFAQHIQNSIYFDGKSSDDIELYRYLAVNEGIDPDEFEKRMNDPEYKDAAHYDFALAKQLGVEGYPAVFIQQSDSKFYLIARGYADYETMELRISNVMAEIRSTEGS
jgi:putative protein-disulfide isomerase